MQVLGIELRPLRFNSKPPYLLSHFTGSFFPNLMSFLLYLDISKEMYIHSGGGQKRYLKLLTYRQQCGISEEYFLSVFNGHTAIFILYRDTLVYDMLSVLV